MELVRNRPMLRPIQAAHAQRPGQRGTVSVAVMRTGPTFVFALLAALAALLAGCGDKFDRTTPEGTILAAQDAVMSGNAQRLGRMIYYENEDQKKLMARLGIFLGNLGDLGVSVQTKFPDEVKALADRTEQAAKEGKATGLFSQLAQQMGGTTGRRRPPAATNNQRGAFDDALKQLFADPYSWAADAETRLTTSPINDNSVALLWDGKPVLAPVGMTMRRGDDDLWYFVLPTKVPGLSGFMPRTKEQYKVFGSVIHTFDRLVIDLKNDVEGGRVSSLEDLSSKAGEKALPPVLMTFYAYGNLLEQQKKQAEAQAKAGPK